MNKRVKQQFWSQTKKRDKKNYVNEETLFDLYFFKLIALYIAIAIIGAVFYSKIIAIIMAALLFIPCVILVIVLCINRK